MRCYKMYSNEGDKCVCTNHEGHTFPCGPFRRGRQSTPIVTRMRLEAALILRVNKSRALKGFADLSTEQAQRLVEAIKRGKVE